MRIRFDRVHSDREPARLVGLENDDGTHCKDAVWTRDGDEWLVTPPPDAVLRRYGAHDLGCPAFPAPCNTREVGCTCGLSAALGDDDDDYPPFKEA